MIDQSDTSVVNYKNECYRNGVDEVIETQYYYVGGDHSSTIGCADGDDV